MTITHINKVAILNWKMTSACNFDCHYCFSRKLGKSAASIPVAMVVSCLQATSRNWHVNLVGGEIMLLPDFIETCIALHNVGMRISLETNLSISERVAEFSENIDPTGVECVHISTHIEEREKRHAVGQLVQDVKLLRDKGFNVYVNYVLHPSLFSRFQADYDLFANHNILLKPAPFVGNYAGEKYPDAYTTQERKIILKANPMAGTYTGMRTYGMLCQAGRDFAVLENGIFFRCKTLKEKLGTIEKGFHLYANAQKCIVRACPCWGYRFLVDRTRADKMAERFKKSSFRVALKINEPTRSFYRGACCLCKFINNTAIIRSARQGVLQTKGVLRENLLVGPLYRKICRLKDAVSRKIFTRD